MAADTFPRGDGQEASSNYPKARVKTQQLLARTPTLRRSWWPCRGPGPLRSHSRAAPPCHLTPGTRGSSTTNTSPGQDSSGKFSRCPLACLSNRTPSVCHPGGPHARTPTRRNGSPVGQPGACEPSPGWQQRREGGAPTGDNSPPPGLARCRGSEAAGGPPLPTDRGPGRAGNFGEGVAVGGAEGRPGPAPLPVPPPLLRGVARALPTPGSAAPPPPERGEPRPPRRPPSPSWAPSYPPAATAACPQLPAPTPPFLLLERPPRRKRLHRPLATRHFPTAAAILAAGRKRKRRGRCPGPGDGHGGCGQEFGGCHLGTWRGGGGQRHLECWQGAAEGSAAAMAAPRRGSGATSGPTAVRTVFPDANVGSYLFPLSPNGSTTAVGSE